jgi:Uncharacterised protein family (UPF0175)
MQTTLEVPEDIARQFADDPTGLSRAAVEALAIEGVRSGKLSAGQARRLLGMYTTSEVDAFLKEHAVYLPVTAEDVDRDAERSRTFRNRWS